MPAAVAALMYALMKFGYLPVPEMRTFGGPFCLRRPDGSLVWESDFAREAERIALAVTAKEPNDAR